MSIPAWTGQAKSKMHTHGITGAKLATQMGVTAQYERRVSVRQSRLSDGCN